MTVIRIDTLSDGSPSSLDNTYVVEYDPSIPTGVAPNGEEMICHLLVTPKVEEAKVFEDMPAAWEYWRQSYGVRDDGEPNRPLTAYTCEFVPAP